MKIITNTAISLDGRIAFAADRMVTLGSEEDRRFMSVLRNRVDALLVGGNVFRNSPVAFLPKEAHLEEPLRTSPLWNVIVSRKMNFALGAPFRNETRMKPLFITDNAFAAAQFPAPVLVSQQPVTPQWIVAELAKKSIRSLLIEAGGDLIFQFLDANLIDELYVTLCPKVIGRRGAPTLADGEGFAGEEIKSLRLVESRVVGDEVFLRYARKD